MNRLEIIKEMLRDKRKIDIITLSEELGVSHVTVRKDLSKLEDEGFLIKTHGMVMLSDEEMQKNLKTDEYDIKDFSEKQKLAQLGKELVENGDRVFIGSGSTCYLLAKELSEIKNMKIVTNNMNIVTSFGNKVNSIFLIGGEIITDDEMQYASGYMNYEFLNGLYVNKAFFKVDGIDSKAGITVNDLSLAKLYQFIKGVSKEIILFGNKENLERIGMYHVGGLEFADTVITNYNVHDELKSELFTKNIRLYSNYDI